MRTPPRTHIESKSSRQQAADRARSQSATTNARDAESVRATLDWLRTDDLRKKKTARRTVRTAYGPRPECVYCGSGAGTADHIVPRAKGGGHRLENLVPACVKCNGAKSDMDLLAFLTRFPKAAGQFLRRAVYADAEHRQIAQRVFDGLTVPVK